MASDSDPPQTPPNKRAKGSNRPRCPASTKTGVRCIAPLRPGQTFCYSHDPALEEQRKRDAAKRIQPGDVGTELGTLDGIARRAAKVLEELETFVVIGDVEHRKGKKGSERKAKEGRDFLAILEPARATARLHALRFLASLVRERTEAKRGKRDGDAPAAKPYSLEEVV